MTLIRLRGGTAAAWVTANPVLALREMGVETDTGRTKTGDGTAVWNTLPYNRSAPRSSSITSASSLTINALTDDLTAVTALAANLTINNPTGTPLNGQSHVLRVKDNGTSRTLTFGSAWRALGVTMPSATTVNKTVYLFSRYNSADSTWDVHDVKVLA